jgi:endonuclease YncB( thermonuclease family)
MSLLRSTVATVAFAAALPCCVAAPYELSLKVTAITDGDTLVGIDANKVQHKIRLAEIDAPERSQPYGKDAKAALSKMVFGKDVVVNVSTRDRYGREIGNVLADGIDVNGSLVRFGYSWCYRAYKHRAIVEQYEAEAKAAKRGLWSAEKQIPPWDYRKGIR